MSQYRLSLYVTGKSHLSQRAIQNLQRICEVELRGRYTMEVIDILEQPTLAEHQRILATPVVVKELPSPLRRVVGDFSNTEEVVFGLDLHEVLEQKT